MTIQEFDNTGWCCGMKCIYRGKEHDIGSCDFEEKLVGVVDDNTDALIWVRCENIVLCA